MEYEHSDTDLLMYLNSNYKDIKIIIPSHNKEIQNIIKAVQNNVRAYLAKDSSATKIINTIRIVRQGNLYALRATQKGTFFVTLDSKILIYTSTLRGVPICVSLEIPLFGSPPFFIHIFTILAN